LAKKLRRYPSVAGIFYEPQKEVLLSQIEWSFKHPLGPGKLPPRDRASTAKEELKAVITPHAGIMYSGPIAAHAYYELANESSADTFVLVGPNHTGLGASIAVYPGGVWVTPLGEISVDEEFVDALARVLGSEAVDEKAHLFEHSIEVQLPFLQYIYGNRFRIVAITMYDQSPGASEKLARALFEAEKQLGRRVTLIATSDLSHYVTREEAQRYDSMVIEALKRLDPNELYRVVTENALPICGLGPLAVALHYSLLRGASRAELLAYATSGDVAGGDASVVGYASLKIV